MSDTPTEVESQRPDALDESAELEAADAPEADPEPVEEPPPRQDHPLKALVREAAEALGEAVRARELDKLRTREARQVLQRAFVFEQAPVVSVMQGVALVDACDALRGVGLGTQARVGFAWRHYHRVMRRWPVTVKCLHRVPIARAAYTAQDMADDRYDRLDAIFRLLNIDSTFATHEIK